MLTTWKQAKPTAGDEEEENEIVHDSHPEPENEEAKNTEKGKEKRNSGSSDTVSDDEEYPGGRDWIAIINPKSGGQSGASVLKQFKESKLLPADQIFSLVPDGPAAALKRWQEDPERFKLIVCGGDGTVGWVLTAIDKLQVRTDPIVGVIPLGTGNDLARVFGWGGGYSGEKLDRILKQFASAKVLKLDRWNILVTPTEQYDPEKHNKPDEDAPEPNDSEEESEEEQEAEKEKERKKESNDQPVKLESQTFIMNNYFSVGVDAEIALSFHKMREANSGLFQHQLVNKGWYGVLGGVAAVTPHGALRKHVTLSVDGRDINIPSKVRGLIVLNLPSYAGGTQPWGKTSKKDKAQYADPAINDVLLEVVGIKGAMHLARIQTHTSARGGIRLAQGKSLKLTVGRALPAQVDGEPWMMPPCVVKVSHLNQANLLYNLSAKGAEKKEKSLTK